MSIHRLRTFLKSLILKERSPKKLAQSFCFGVYIAFSPLLGLHTLMAVAFPMIFSLNFAVTFATQIFIHNPWTMVPIYTLDYVFGDWLLCGQFGCHTIDWNPGWMIYVNKFITHYIPIADIALWSFLIGGNLLALLLSIGLYPIVKPLFTMLSASLHKNREDGHENHRTK